MPPLPSGVSYVDVASGDYHCTARRSDGTVVCWGDNLYGQCNIPPIAPGVSVVEIDACSDSNVARLSDGSLLCWGDGTFGSCGEPSLPAGLTHVEVATGTNHGCARRNDGALVFWGSSSFGSTTPPVLPAGRYFTDIDAGNARSGGVYESVQTTYCTAKVNSLGCVPAIAASGYPSASAPNGYVVTCQFVRNNKPGVLFYGFLGGTALPFQGGLMCVSTSIKRTPGTNSGGNLPPANDCSGLYSFDMNCFASGSCGGNPPALLRTPGTTVNCQWWGRDPGFAAPNNTTLSNALEYTVGQ